MEDEVTQRSNSSGAARLDPAHLEFQLDEQAPLLEGAAAKWLGSRYRRICDPKTLVAEAKRAVLAQYHASTTGLAAEDVQQRFQHHLGRAYQRFLLSRVIAERVDPLKHAMASSAGTDASPHVAEDAESSAEESPLHFRDWFSKQVTPEGIADYLHLTSGVVSPELACTHILTLVVDAATSRLARAVDEGREPATSFKEMNEAYKREIWREFVRSYLLAAATRHESRVTAAIAAMPIDEAQRPHILRDVLAALLEAIDAGEMDRSATTAPFDGRISLEALLDQQVWRHRQRILLDAALQIDNDQQQRDFIEYLSAEVAEPDEQIQADDFPSLLAGAEGALRDAIRRGKRTFVDAGTVREMQARVFTFLRRQVRQRKWHQEVMRLECEYLGSLAARMRHKDLASSDFGASDLFASAGRTVLRSIDAGLCDADTLAVFRAFFRTALERKFIDKAVPAWKHRTVSVSNTESDDDGDPEAATWIEIAAKEQDDAASRELAEKVFAHFETVLSAQEQDVIGLLFNLSGDDSSAKTQEEVGAILKLSRDQVKRTKKNALEKLRLALTQDELA